MNYIQCGAYRSLLFALYLKYLGKEITVITDNNDVAKYCEAENIPYIGYKKIRLTASTIYRIFTFKIILKKLMKEIDFRENDEFYLMGKALNLVSFYLAKEFSKKGSIFYKNTDRELKRYKPYKLKPFYIRGGIMRILFKLSLGLDLIYYDTFNSPRLGVDDKFLKKYNINEYAPEISSKELISEVIKKHKSSFKEYDNLIIDDGLLIGYANIDSLINLYKKLSGLNISFAFKRHPNLSSDKEKHPDLYFSLYKNIKGWDEIPTYIPAELLFNNIKKNVLSICSTATIPASHITHLRTISLLELVDWYDETTKKNYKNEMVKGSNNKIVFPKNFEELKALLAK